MIMHAINKEILFLSNHPNPKGDARLRGGGGGNELRDGEGEKNSR